jgi:hypothetical protein
MPFIVRNNQNGNVLCRVVGGTLTQKTQEQIVSNPSNANIAFWNTSNEANDEVVQWCEDNNLNTNHFTILNMDLSQNSLPPLVQRS